jgi:small subunit ribosomal protein S6
MPETRINHYEGMFLLSQAATADLGAAVDHVKSILDKVEAELIAMSRWDERRLAYEIKKQKRGLFLLTYFSCNSRNIAQLERECNLSETVLRAMVIRADHLTEEEMRNTDAQQELLTEASLRREEAEESAQSEPAAAGAESE